MKQSQTIVHKIGSTARNRQIWRYGIIGALTQSIDLGSYAILVALGLHYVVADFVNNPLSLGFNYLGHKYFTFQKNPWKKGEFVKYLLTLVLNYLYTTAILIVFVDLLGLNAVIGKIAQIITVACFNYLVLKRYVFVT